MTNWIPMQMNRAQQVVWAQEQIARLAPLEHASVKKLNDILTDERLNASEERRSFGLTGLPLLQHVMSSLRLSDEQRMAVPAARLELCEIREAIAPHVALLLDEQQTEPVGDDASESE